MAKLHFVSRYKYSHYDRRAKFNKWRKQGRVKLINRRQDGWLYEELPEYPITVIRSRRHTKFLINQGK